MPSAGDFTATALVNAIDKADEFWDTAQIQRQYMAKTGFWDAIKKEQTADVRLLEEPEKDRDLTISWVNACGITTAAVTDDCTLAGVELLSDKKTYALTTRRKSGFKVRDKIFRSNELTQAEVVAKGFLRAGKELDEYITRAGVVAVDAFGGTASGYMPPGSAFVSGELTIPESSWTADIIPELILMGEMNRFADPFLISGSLLWKEDWHARINAANAEGKGTNAKFDAFRIYHDLFNVDVQNSPFLKAYLIDAGSVAFASKAYYPTTPIEYLFKQRRWSISSRNLDGVDYDVYYTQECVEDEIWHIFELHTKFGYYLTPEGSEAGVTGVYTLKQVADPEPA